MGRKNSMRNQIVEVLRDKKDGLSLQELYKALPGLKKDNVRSVLNICVKRGEYFVRLSKGVYGLKEDYARLQAEAGKNG